MKAKIQHLKAKYRYSAILLKQLVKTDFKIRYQNSVLGYLWTLLKPLGLFFVLYVVFVNFLRVGGDVPYFPVYLLLGIVFWTYFTEVTTGGIATVVTQGEVLRKLAFPRYVIVLAGSFSALINLLINLGVVAVFMVISDVPFRLSALLIALPMLELFVFALAMAFLLSALYVKFRDIAYIWEVGMQGLFYATPILYPLSLVIDNSSADVAKILMLNPIAQIIQDARYFAITEQTDTIGSLYGSAVIWLVPIGFVLLSAVLAGWYFKSRSPYFAEEL